MHLDQVDLVTWHQRPELQKLQQSLSQEQWPSECHVCEHFESQGRGDSMCAILLAKPAGLKPAVV